MGYWVINKHLESHLLISEGHPWGICDPLSRPKTLHTSSVCTIPQCLSTPALTFHPDIQPGFVLTWDWFRDFVDWFGFWEFGGLILFSYTPHKSFFLAADCNQQWGKLAELAENRTNTVPWFVQLWGIFLWFGRKTRLQRGGTMVKFTPVNKLQLHSGVDDKRKFWMSRSWKRRLWTGVF